MCFTLGLPREPPFPRSESHSRLLFCRTRILSPGCYCINLKCCGKYPSSVIPPLFSSLLSSPSSWSKDFWSQKRKRGKKKKFEAPPNLHFARTAYLKHDASILVTHMSLSFYTQFTICYSLGIHSTFSHDIKDEWKSWKRRGRTQRDGAARTGHWRSVSKHIKGNQDSGGKTSTWLVLPLSPCLQFP